MKLQAPAGPPSREKMFADVCGEEVNLRKKNYLGLTQPNFEKSVFNKQMKNILLANGF